VTPVALELRRITVRRDPDQAPALREASLSIGLGERVALVGCNGSGKTTLLLAVVGLLEHQGEIEVDGTRVAPRTLEEVRRKVGFLFNLPEDQLLFPRVIDDVAFSLHRLGVPPGDRHQPALRALTELGVGHLADRPVHHLSHGQKQLAALAGALVGSPTLLLLDEPSSGLDPPGRRHLANLLCRRTEAMLLATHDLDFAERVCSRFVMLEQGRVVEGVASATDVLERWEVDT
jgi:cobalt/nickel transport system ATP-binding protein